MKTRTEQADRDSVLEDLLSRWHHYCRGFRLTAGTGSQPMFRFTTRPRGGQTVEALMEDETEKGQMKAIDFHVYEMQDPYRSAILMLARNCYTGRNVWMSPRLPEDALERGRVVQEARIMLTRRLTAAGVM